MAPVASKFDHEDRLDLKTLLEKPRTVKPLADIKMKVNLAGGQVKKTSVMEMVEEYKAFEDGGQVLLNDGILMIPVVDYLKAKLKIKSVETVERMEKELNLMHQDLIGKGGVGTVGHSRVDHQIRCQAGRVEEMQPVVLESRHFRLWC